MSKPTRREQMAYATIAKMEAKIAELEARAGGWIKCSDRLPELKDDSVLAYADGTSPHAGEHAWPKGGIDMVHIQDYFGDVSCGLDETGKQLYTQMYLSNGVTHWQPLPAPPTE